MKITFTAGTNRNGRPFFYAEGNSGGFIFLAKFHFSTLRADGANGWFPTGLDGK